MPRPDVIAGHYYGQLMTLPTPAAAGQQLHGSLSWALSQVTDLAARQQATPMFSNYSFTLTG